MNNRNDNLVNINEFKNIIEKFNQDNYQNKDFLEYLTLLNMKNKLKKLQIDATELEDKIYSYKNKIMTDKERILFEYKIIINYIRENWKEIKKLPKKDIDEFFCLFEELSKLIKSDIKDNKNNIDDSFYEIKKIIFQIQIKLNLSTTFYSIVDRMLNEKNVGKEFKK